MKWVLTCIITFPADSMHISVASQFAFNLFHQLAAPWALGVWLMLLASRFRKDPVARWRDFSTALGFVILSLVGAFLHSVVIRLTPHTMDAAFFRADAAIGFNSALPYSWLVRHRGILAFTAFMYDFFPLVMCIAWIAEQSITMRDAVLIGGVGCWITYVLLPACGPLYFNLGATADAWRNCMPSMHMTWALLMAINAKCWLRVPLWLYAGVIAFATLAGGEHYLIDLIAAIPYTIAVQYIASLPKPAPALQRSQFSTTSSGR